MSGITQYPPAGARKSFQSGETICITGVTDITVSSINPAKRRLTLLGFVSAGETLVYAPRIKLLNATTIRINCPGAGSPSVGFTVTVNWELEEIY